ncbi:sensor histidine kinase [Streptococcus respiraculi]|uniref:sensor histidine kinase n=1 Tax=Streptococcus respiraculi TaxID=2021971 RepID=UPI001F0C057B|nr:sensor histidine kinase [Streptococcus respiraculi]
MMTHFPDIPRVYTALSESIACCLVCLPLIMNMDWLRKMRTLLLIFTAQILLQLLAGQFPILLWTVGMGINISWMFASIYLLGVKQQKTALYLTAKAFIAAELVASLAWHLYCLTIYSQPVDNLWTQTLFMGIISSIAFLLFYQQNRKINLEELQNSIEKREVWVAVFTSLSIFILSNIGFILSGTPQFQDSTSIFILRTTVNFSGILLLLTQESQQYDRYLREELVAIHNMFQMQYKQYQAYRENNDLISRKAHDLKHQLYIIQQEANKQKQQQYLKEMTVAIQNLEAKIETGNPVLDTILTQKNQYCLQNGINFTCIVQGQLLHFMDVMDISALFGNAIDNAIEAVEKISNPEQRLMTLKVSQHSQFIVIRLDNYDTSDIDLSTGQFPQTSKKEKALHGIGLKSMAFIVQKYGGNLTLNKEDNWVQLKILLPVENN